MPTYRVRTLAAAARDLARLDKPVRYRVAERLKWLTENLDNIRPEPLVGDLLGLCKLRVGDYRVVYQILYDEQTILIHAVGHRRDIYRKLSF